MKILVTGANGFVGQYLLRELLSRGEDQLFAATGPNYGRNPMLSTLGDPHSDQIEWGSLDMTDYHSIDAFISHVKPDQVYHLAGIAVTSGYDEEAYFRVNALGTYRLAKSVLAHRGAACPFLFVSSSGVYGAQQKDMERMDESQVLRPSNAYGASKAAAEMLLWSLYRQGLDLRIARPFNHTGPGQRAGFVCADIIEKLKGAMHNRVSSDESVQIRVSRLDSVRDFLDVRDVVKAYVSMMNMCQTGAVLNVSSGRGYAIGDIIEMLQDILAERMDFTVASDQSHAFGDVDRSVGDSYRLGVVTGWGPDFSMKDTLRDMCIREGTID